MTGELLKSRANLDVLHVPYKGGGPAVVAAIAGEVSIYYGIAGSAMGSIRAGKLKALAVAAPSRYSVLPNVPTFAELGYPDIVASEWNGVFAPKGTPPEILQLLNTEVRAVAAEPRIQDALTSMGVDVVTSSPAEFSTFVRNETARWGKIIKELNIRAE